MKKSILILLAILFAINLNSKAEDFSAVYNGDTIYYKFTSTTSPLTVGVTFKGPIYYYNLNEYTGSVSIPDSVEYNGYYYKVTSIDTFAFSKCSGLTSITIPNSVTSIYDNAFSDCFGLTSITIPNSVTSIGSSAFSSCTSLTSITIPNSVISISNGAFIKCSSLTTIIIPNSITKINNFTFFQCSGLTSIIIPNSVTSIGMYAFTQCPGMTYINIPNSVTSIGEYAFYECSGLNSIKIPDSVAKINYATFYGCTGLSSVIISNSVDTIDEYAFYHCTGLTSIISNAINPPAIKNLACINGVNRAIPVYIPCNSISSYQSAPYWSTFTNFIEKNIHFIDTAICKGSTFTSYGANIDSAGVYNFVNGCDSTILTLSINPTYFDTIIAKICQGETYTQFGFNVDSTGLYTQNLQTINGCDSIIVLNLLVNPTPIIPHDLVAQAMSDYIELTWQGDSNTYVIYRNDDSLTTTTSSMYLDYDVILGQSYCYKVKSINGVCESEFSDTICKTYLGLEDISLNNIQTNLYPNPTEGKTKLEVEGLKNNTDILVYDMIGRVIQRHKINQVTKVLDIDLSGYAKGIYNIRIVNENINQTKKLIVQ